ncbi:MAG: hypothetical protein V4528_13780 [Pseudomonadota bacterium]
MQIVIRTNHPMVLLSLSEGLPTGVRVNIPPVIERRDISIPDILDVIVHVARDVDIGLLTVWLSEKIKPSKNSAKLYINRIEVTLEQGEIRRLIVEQIRQETDN